MPTERMEEVEVVCPSCWHDGSCSLLCEGTGTKTTAVIRSGSLTAARLRLADAAEAREAALRAWDAAGRTIEECSPLGFAWSAAVDEYNAAVAALRTARGEG